MYSLGSRAIGKFGNSAAPNAARTQDNLHVAKVLVYRPLDTEICLPSI